MKRVIGLDFDDVLMDFHNAMHPYLNPRYNTALTRDKVFTHNLEELWGCSKEEAERRIVDFYHSPEHDEAPPFVGAPEAVRELSKKHSLVVITSRPNFIKDRTLHWIDRHFRGLFNHVCFTNLFAGDGYKKKTKSEACIELGVEVFVDDYLGYATDVAENGRKVLLMDAPWNQGEVHPNITRVYSWDEILEILK